MGTADGVPRAVHAVRALHRQAARPVAVPRARRAQWLAARSLHANAGRHLRTVRAVDRADAGVLRTAPSQVAWRLRRGPPLRRPRQGARHAARHAAGGDAVECRHLRDWTGLRGAPAAHAREPARRSPRVRSRDAGRVAEGHPGVSRSRRSARSRRTLEPYLADARSGTAAIAAESARRRGTARNVPRSR